jgi:hypothetical protein
MSRSGAQVIFVIQIPHTLSFYHIFAILFAMSPEEKSLLENIHVLVKENNQILHSMQRSARIGTAMKVFYWALIIFMSFGAYYLIQPYLNMLTSLSGDVSNNINTLSNLKQNIDGLLK